MNHSFDPRLDEALLVDLYDNDAEHALMAFNDFLKTSPALMKEIELELVNGTVEVFRQKVHKLKPIFSYVGLPGMTHTAETIEKKCKDAARTDELKILYADLKLQFDANYPVIQQEAGKLATM